MSEPIAVIGIGCRFAGAANSPQAFWEMLAEGRDAVREMPPDHRYDVDKFYHPDIKMPGKTTSRWGSFLDNIDEFDAAFFGISQREAMFMDPQQRILLEVAWEALERAGLPPENLVGSSTGVYMGIFNRDYVDCILDEAIRDQGASINGYVGTGTGNSFAAGRISYLLGLQGPSMIVDTVCSSSLVAVHLACQSLRNEECGLALAGAVDLNFHPFGATITSKMRVFSPRGRCRTFDASADGFVRGEGCGVLVLKKYSKALADGDTVMALIRGSAVNHDGRSKGLTAPNGEAQKAVLQQALRNAGVAPEQISYIEAHGTGTARGDPIEFEALNAVIGRAHPKGSVCLVGSVKTNIGHLEAAAGMAGLVKTILCMQHQAIPPHLHLETLNPRINLEHTPFVIPTHLSRWSASAGPRFAGVSASGLSGTNAHVVLEEVSEWKLTDDQDTGKTWVLPLSAKNIDGLRQLAQTWHRELQSQSGILSTASLRHICSTASLRRTHYQQRLAFAIASHGELTKRLEAFLEEDPGHGMTNGVASCASAHPVFIFSGQGAQWAGMGQELLKEEPVFRNALEKCDALLQIHVSWSLITELQAEEAKSRLHETEVAQPALFCFQVALSDLWRSWGIEPAAVVGHSVGEITSAYVSGAIALEDAIRIVAHRGMLMQQTQGMGYMVAAEISETKVREFLVNYDGRVTIAAVNSPTSVVLSGDSAALHEIVEKLQRDQILVRKLNVDCAFHNPKIMEPLKIPLVERLEGIKPRVNVIPLFSTVTGDNISGEQYDPTYWARNMCETVRFGPAIENILRLLGYGVFLEISPRPVLGRYVKQSLAHHSRSGLILSSLRRGVNERTSMLTALGTLYTHGLPIKWEGLYPTSSIAPDKVVSLPTYPWQRKHYWFESKKQPFAQCHAFASSGRLTGHPLLGRRVRSATDDRIFEIAISTRTHPWLSDHKASGVILFPGSGYVEMMQESVRMALNYDIVRLTDLYFHQALTFSPGQERVVQLVLQSSADNLSGKVQILSCSGDESESTDAWTLHSTGHYCKPDTQVASISMNLEIIKQRCTQSTNGREHYQRTQASGLEYGAAFQVLRQMWRGQGEAVAELCLPQQLEIEAGSYFMHPAFLDGCLHTAAGILSDERGDLYLPLSMDSVIFYQRPRNEIWVYIKVLTSDLKQGFVTVLVHILNEQRELVGLIEGLHLRRASRSAFVGQRRISPPHWIYKLQWDMKARQGANVHQGDRISSASPRSWLFFCDHNGIGTRLAENLRARGQCFLIFSEQRYQRVIESDSEYYTLNPSCPEHFLIFLQDCMPLLKYSRCSIVYLWGADAASIAEGSSEQLLTQEQERLCGGLLHLVQAVVQSLWAAMAPQLWVITQNSQDVSGLWRANSSAVVQGPLWGLGRSIAFEHPDLHCRLVDLPDQNSWDWQGFIGELLDPEPEDQIAFRVEGRYIARLAVAESDIAYRHKQRHIKSRSQGESQDSHEMLKFSPSGTYLITGGLGGLGIAIAQWMVEQRGALHLALTGRRAPTPKVRSIIRQLEQHGAKILVLNADIADHNQVAEMLEIIQQAGKPLRGIIHAAGILDDRVLVHQNWERFAHVLAPKMHGSWNLHLLTQNLDLDFFALFSSAAALVPAPGQANYAAANAFMDGLAHYRRSLNLPAVSINWGAWADVGMTKDAANFETRLQREGVHLMSLEEGMAAFEQVLLDNPIQVAVLPIDWSMSNGAGRQSPILSNLLGEHHRQGKQAITGARNESKAMNGKSYTARVHERPQTLVEDVSRHAIEVLGLDPTSHFESEWNLFDRGMDSFMAIEFRNALQKETAISLPANLVFDHPTVRDIATYLAQQLALVDEIE